MRLHQHTVHGDGVVVAAPLHDEVHHCAFQNPPVRRIAHVPVRSNGRPQTTAWGDDWGRPSLHSLEGAIERPLGEDALTGTLIDGDAIGISETAAACTKPSETSCHLESEMGIAVELEGGRRTIEVGCDDGHG